MVPSELGLPSPEDVAALDAAALPGFAMQLAALQTALAARLATSGPPAPATPHEIPYLSVPEVAQRLGVPAQYVYDLARQGDLPTLRFGKYVRIAPVDLQRWLDAHHQRPGSVAPSDGTR